MRRLLGACALALSLIFPALLVASPVGASGDFCETDPLVVIRTPLGQSVTMYVDVAAMGIQHQGSLVMTRINYTAVPTADGTGSNVSMTVTVPNDIWGASFPTIATVSSGPNKTGIIYGTASGVSGRPMYVNPQPFALPVP